MKISVCIEREKKCLMVDMKPGSTIKDLIKELKINPVTVVIAKNKEIVTELAKLKDKDSVEFLSVVGGG